MNEAAARLASRVAVWLAVFSATTAVILGSLMPSLLLLSPAAADAGASVAVSRHSFLGAGYRSSPWWAVTSPTS